MPLFVYLSEDIFEKGHALRIECPFFDSFRNCRRGSLFFNLLFDRHIYIDVLGVQLGTFLVATRVAPQNTQHISGFAQVAQRVAAVRLIHMADKVQIKKVLPWFAAKRPRFDLHEIQIAQGKGAQRPEERSGNVSCPKYKRGLPLSPFLPGLGHALRISRPA